MCGILVWVNKNHQVETTRFVSALMLLRHRGPDAQRCYFIKETGLLCEATGNIPASPQNIAMGQTRLSIIDLSPRAHGPFVGTEGEHVLVYNGEIYNYLEEKSKFVNHLHDYISKSDTEVLFRALISKGPGVLNDLNGMWAFAFLDWKRKNILLSRDQYGKKPLFYYFDENNFIAASEMKSIFSILGIRRRVNIKYCSSFLLGKLSPVFWKGETIFENVYEVPPGCNLHFDITKHQISISENHALDKFLTEMPGPDQLGGDLADAVNLRLRSDVPLGIQVSGGVDSSAIAGITKILNNKPTMFFTVRNYGNEGEITEDYHYSKMLARELNIELVEIDVLENIENIHQDFLSMTKQYEYPINPFMIAYSGYIMSKKISECGIKVFLDGTGGDEVLGGYPQYPYVLSINFAESGDISQSLKFYSQFQKYKGDNIYSLAKNIFGIFKSAYSRKRNFSTPEEKILAVLNEFSEWTDIKEAGKEMVDNFFVRYKAKTFKDLHMFDIKSYQLPYALYVNDQNSMMHSIENRSPLLDVNLIKYINISSEYKVKNGFNKYFFRKSMPANISDKIRWRRGKIGLGFSPNFLYTHNKENFLSSVFESKIARRMIAVNKLERLEKELLKRSEIMTLFRNFYSLAMLEQVWNCEV